MVTSERLLAFFRSEFTAEERSGFARLKRVPESRVEEQLAYYQSLCAADKASFIDCCAHWALSNYGFVIEAQRPEIKELLDTGTQAMQMTTLQKIRESSINHTKHPFFPRWSKGRYRFHSNRDVKMLRVAVSQYKLDRRRGVPSCVSEDLFRFAESVKSIKALELRKRVRAVLNKFGYQKTDQFGGHRCVWEGQEFEVDLDYGGRDAQLRYSVIPSEFRPFQPPGLCFEIALGMGLGHWNYIVEENVDEVFLLFEELIKYAVNLPKRMMEA
jgi:hypothetical protein